ncbi:unnamed protein product [Alopecurus aequalis]
MSMRDKTFRCYVGNLATVTEEYNLQHDFSEFGKILEFKIMKGLDTAWSRRFGFVTFDNEESLCEAITAMNGTPFKGSNIILRRIGAPGSSGNIYIGDGGIEYKCSVDNLSVFTDVHDFHAAFRKFGEILEYKITTDADTGCSRGFGFVTFASKDSLSAVIEAMNNKDLDGRPIRVTVVHPTAS